MRREALLWGATIGALAFLSTHAFPSSVRDWLKRRDGGCQFPAPHKCEGPCECHHVIPEAYCKRMGIDPNFAQNGIMLCRNSHQKLIHQDSDVANRIEGEGADKALFAHRADLMNQGQIYWNDRWDRQLLVRAVQNTQKYEAEHPDDPFPSDAPPRPPKHDHSKNGQSTTEPPAPRPRSRI